MKSKTLEKKFFFSSFWKWNGGKKKKCDQWYKFCYSATKTIKNHVNSQAAIERLSDYHIPWTISDSRDVY